MDTKGTGIVCDKCGAGIQEGDEVCHGGRTLCDDCAMSAMSPAKACDPWAVKMATGSFKTKADAVATLQGLEKRIYELVAGRGRVASEELPALLGVTMEEVRRAFSVLRHMELLRGERRSDGGSDVTGFDAERRDR